VLIQIRVKRSTFSPERPWLVMDRLVRVESAFAPKPRAGIIVTNAAKKRIHLIFIGMTPDGLAS